MVAYGFTTCLWFDGRAEEAANFYVSLFKDSKLGRVGHYTEAGPRAAGSVLAVDHYWSRLTEGGGEPGPCGWLKDRYGVSWQVIPEGLIDMLDDSDPERSRRTTQAVYGMSKLDIAALRKAYQGE